MIPISRKIFAIIFKDFKTGKMKTLGPYRMSGFINQFGTPSEREIFDQAVNQGKVYMGKIDQEFELQPEFIYHLSEEALTEEYIAKTKV